MKKILYLLTVLLFVAVITPNERASANSSYATAQIVDVNSEIQGVLPGTSYEHYYKFTIPANGLVELRMKNFSGYAWQAKIVNIEGKTVEYIATDYDSFANGYKTSFTGLAAGEYFVVISNYTSSSNKTYTFSVDYEAGNTYEKELNDTLSTANDLMLNQTYRATVTDNNDNDFYKFTLTKPGNIELSLKNMPGASWYATIYNSEEQYYTSINSAYNEFVTGSTVTNVGLPAGTYYIKVSNYTSSADKIYEMTVNYTQSELYEKEFNDNAIQASPAKVNNTYKGALQKSGDIDFYQFDLASAANVTLSMPNVEGSSWYVTLQDDKGETIEYFNTSYSNIIKKSNSASVGLPKGRYYVKISSYTGTVNRDYAVTISAKNSKVHEKEHNDSFATATPLTLGTAFTGRIGNKSSSDVDYYKIVNDRRNTVHFSLTQTAGSSWYIILYDENGEQLHYNSTKYDALVKGNLTFSKVLNKGTYYVKISNYTNATGKPYNLKVSQTTDLLQIKNITVKNNKGKADTITVKGIKAGTIVKVYNSKSKQIATVTSKGTTATLSVKQLGKAAGKIYVSLQDPGKLASPKKTIAYSKEK